MERTLPASPETVWGVLLAWETQPRWMRDASSVRVLGPNREGAGVRLAVRTRVFHVPLFTEELEVTRWEPASVMVIEHRSFIRGSGEWRLRRVESGTAFRWTEVSPCRPAAGRARAARVPAVPALHDAQHARWAGSLCGQREDVVAKVVEVRVSVPEQSVGASDDRAEELAERAWTIGLVERWGAPLVLGQVGERRAEPFVQLGEAASNLGRRVVEVTRIPSSFTGSVSTSSNQGRTRARHSSRVRSAYSSQSARWPARSLADHSPPPIVPRLTNASSSSRSSSSRTERCPSDTIRTASSRDRVIR